MARSTSELAAPVVCLIGLLTLCPCRALAQHVDSSCGRGDRTSSEKATNSNAGEGDGDLFQDATLIVDSIPWGGARVNAYISRLGGKLARATTQPLRFRVLYSPEVNAWALAGGIILLNSGVITAAENEAELAAVLAHEIAHVAAGHARRGAIGLVAGPGARLKDRMEREADRLALEYLLRAGYDPSAAQGIFERLRNPQKTQRLQLTSVRLASSLDAPGAAKLGDGSEFYSVRDEVLRYDETYARALGLSLPGEAPLPPKLSRRPAAASRASRARTSP